LAGGLGRRIGGAKATVRLHGKPLIAYPLEAMRGVLAEVFVLAKADTVLPSLPGATVWMEPDVARHPLVGLVHAIELAAGRPVVVCAADLPFVGAGVIRGLAAADPGSAPAVVASCRDQVQPLLGCYWPAALEPLRRHGAAPDIPLHRAVSALEPRLFELEEPEILFNVNSPDDLLQAAAMLDRGYPNVKS
jgi:molybdopterin-guanine dinucleotide biosynthesis protein A